MEQTRLFGEPLITILVRYGVLLALILLGLVSVMRGGGRASLDSWGARVLAFWAAAQIAFVVFLWFNHLGFPLNLDLMEGTVLQHFRRALAGQPIYPEPTPAYVPLAYNPLFYYLAVPFAWIFGDGLATLRLVAILGFAGCGWIIWRLMRERTASIWWATITVGLFAAAYRVMDAYLDSAHSDSWFICSALAGTYLLNRKSAPGASVAGMVLLVASFWFKQHGAFFVLGGLLFLGLRDGFRASVPAWLVALGLGPLLYLFAGPTLFGSQFHFFTWQVPSQWAEPSLRGIIRFGAFAVVYYLPFLISATWWVVEEARAGLRHLDVWQVQFAFALLTGFLGTLDAGSSNNVYIAEGVWIIVIGSLGLFSLPRGHPLLARWRLPALAVAALFVLVFYDPRSVIVSPRADDRYQELVSYLRSLEGQVYAPSLGILQSGFDFIPTAHWVALEDLIRGPGRDTRDHPNTRRLLGPALEPKGQAYILANYPLETYAWIEFLGEHYRLEDDLGSRFEPLRVLPKRWDHGWPRYLYIYTGGQPEGH